MESTEIKILRTLGASEMTSRRLALASQCSVRSVQHLIRRRILVVVGRAKPESLARCVRGLPIVKRRAA